MNIPTITMDPEVARQKLRAFRSYLHKDTEEVYAQCAKAYEQLAKGTPLLKLSEAIQAGGVDNCNRPRLAIAAADRKEVAFSSPWKSDVAVFRTAERRRAKGRLLREVRFPSNGKGRDSGFALVPMVPADVRPKVGQLRDWFVLWEVDHWSDRPQHLVAPIDPLLLSHLGGDLYAILAQWDLTEIERTILSGTMQGA